MAESNYASTSPLRSLFNLILLVAAIAAGIYFAPRLVPSPKIGIVRVNYDIAGPTTAEFMQQMEYARNNSEVKAIVLIINSPGGLASYSEEMFMDVLHTREYKPVYASVDLLAASGAYFAAAAAEEIYAKPTSFIGSIGVIASFPGPVFIDDEILTTGPYKLFGATQEGAVRQVEMAKFSFLDAVATGRGDRLDISLEELSRAEIYTGVQAQRFGMIDGLLSTEQVIELAAERLGLQNYETVDLYPIAVEGQNFPTASYTPTVVDPNLLWHTPSELAPGLYYRYMELPATQ